MVSEAEEFAEQDKKVKARIDARNQLETYCYNMKQVGDEPGWAGTRPFRVSARQSGRVCVQR